MDYTLIYVLLGVSIVQAGLTVVAAYYAYKVTRVVGLFWAWGFIVAAFVINALQGVSSAVSIFFIPIDQLTSLISQFNPAQIFFSSAINLLSAALLAAGMYGLLKIFSRPRKVEARPVLQQ